MHNMEILDDIKLLHAVVKRMHQLVNEHYIHHPKIHKLLKDSERKIEKLLQEVERL